ncbi:16S rRNA (guanine(527)-N(7))-methyltransferase RsmG [Corynebacterium sp. zg254]|uniref:Ribosomal RNA small subunit methyltransferase G n=1 Tax=Corynebacterium zhongnanshanii TaxID=2768834 RepID=A0ABQ6VC56_9CORY|nr:16S rRNA (guanine(527)-N(7))-methyltransferase RsmG [Corynebacterium zhongnanshanii]MCR5915021.1 16S rRNA (guanine(527)-N(7))-methyltransferase RsmG [Corynebacterium sp. zg254]
MFHVKHPDAAAQIFGDRLPLAVRYAELLETVATERGLIGPREVPRIWDRHILNSAVLSEAIDAGLRVIDVGSGAGLPGIPLAIARPDLTVQLLEPLLRRTTFLNEVVTELELDNSEVIRGRAEDKDTIAQLGGADIVTSRAVAPLGKLVQWSLPLVKKDGDMRALKGSSVADEIERDASIIKKAGGGQPRVLEVGAKTLAESTHVVVVPRIK